MNFGKEWEHLKQRTEKDKESMKEKISELKQQGRSLRDIADEVGVSHMTVMRSLKDSTTP
jgi:transposase-like protein